MTHNAAHDDWDLIVTPWHLDDHIAACPVPIGPSQLVRPSLPVASQLERMNLLYQAVAATMAEAARPLLLSCDCPAGVGAVAGLQRRYDDLAVVWLDGHGDFNTPATTISGYLGGMPLAMLTGRAPELISDPLQLRPLADSNVVLVDARDLDPAEHDALASSQVHRLPADPAAIGTALGQLGHRPVYLHIDVDVIDGSQLPGLRFPVASGPALTQIEDCIASVTTTAEVIAACIACTWLPERINDQTSREAITRLGAALGAQLAW